MLLRMKQREDKDVGQMLVQLMGQRKDKPLTSFEFHRYATTWWQSHIWYLDSKNPTTYGLLERLLLQKTDIHAVDASGRTVLSHAAERGTTTIVDILLAHGASASADDLGKTPLHWVVEGGHHSVVSALLKKAAQMAEAPDYLGRTPLLLVMEKRHLTWSNSLSTVPW
ncbi:ankyrin repeat-containing domain protein [Aspergillus terricola var. indicus]